MATLLRRVSAWTALVTFSAAIGLGWMVLGHQGADDPACQPLAVVISDHTHSAAQFEAPRESPTDHCEFCHLQRAVGGGIDIGAGGGLNALQPVDWALSAGSRLPRPAVLDAHLSRGPPLNS